MSPKTSLVVLIALLAVATALATTAHSANQNGDDFFATVKSAFYHDGKINTLNSGLVAVVVLAITALVRSSKKHFTVLRIKFFVGRSLPRPPSCDNPLSPCV